MLKTANWQTISTSGGFVIALNNGVEWRGSESDFVALKALGDPKIQGGIPVFKTRKQMEFLSPNALNEFDSVQIAGVLFNNINNDWRADGGFTASIYSALKAAATTPIGEAFASGATKLQVINEDASIDAYIGYGDTLQEAIANAGSGNSGINRFFAPAKTVIIEANFGYAYYAWKSVSGTPSLRITQGV